MRTAKKNRIKRIGSLLLALVLVICLNPGLGVSASGVSALSGGGCVSIAPIADQTARIVVSGGAPGSVDWGNEPLVVTIHASNGREDDLAVTKAPDTSINDLSYSVDVLPRGHLDAQLNGSNGNILVLTPMGVVGAALVTVTATDAVTGDSASASFKVDVNRYEDTGEYDWGDMELPGSGFVSGLLFHPNFPDRLYARTDVGGAYRFNFESNRWEAMTFWASSLGGTNRSLNSGGVSALAVDPNMPDSIFMMSSNTLYASLDRGATWQVLSTASVGMVGANASGRGIGERLAVISPGPDTPLNQLEIWAGGSSELRRSLNGGGSWTTIPLRPRTGVRNPNSSEASIGFIKVDPLNPDFMIVSTGGTNGNPANTVRLRGPSIYYTERRSAPNADFLYTGNNPNNADVVFKVLPFQPAPPIPESDWASFPTSGNPIFGYVGFRADFSKFALPESPVGERHFFVSFTDPGVPWGNDSFHMEGGSGMDGAVFRYSVNADGKLMPECGKNVSPRRVESVNIRAHNNPVGGNTNGTTYRQHGTAIASMSVCGTNPGSLIITTHNTDMTDTLDPRLYQRNYDIIYRSLDYGETWFPVLGGYDLYGAVGDENGRLANAPHLSPWANATKNIGGVNPYYPEESFDYYNPIKHGATEAWFEAWPSFFHWNGSAIINPFNPDHLVMNGGNGTFVTWNLTALDEVGKLHAEPHLVSQYADPAHPWDPTGELRGFFIGKGWRNDIHDNVLRELIDYTPDKNLESRFPYFRINGGNGTTTRDSSVQWDGIRGLNMTVAKDGILFSPPTGDFILLAGQGDKSGSLFYSLYEPCENTIGHKFQPDPRAIGGGELPIIKHAGSNSTSVDYSDNDPSIMVAGIRGEWHKNVMGAIQITFDGGKQWYNLPDGWEGTATAPGGLPQATLTRPEYQTLGIGAGMPTTATRGYVTQLKSDGVMDAGWVAMSADSKVILWQIGGTGGEPSLTHMQVQRAVRTEDYGQTWQTTSFWNDLTGTTAAGATTSVKIIADRVNPNVFYAFENSQARVYISNDKGKNFYRVGIGGALSSVSVGNWANNTFGLNVMYFNALRGREGELLVGGADLGSFKISVTNLDGAPAAWNVTSVRITPSGGASATNTSTHRIGYGLGVNADAENVALYRYGRINAVNGNTQTGTGIFRSVDGGATWRKISKTSSNPDALNMDNHSYQDVRAINGDARTFGRVYFSTGNGTGAFRWGEMITELLKSPISDKVGLELALRAAEGFLDNADLSEYPQEFIDALILAVGDAIDIIGDEDADQAAVDMAIAALYLDDGRTVTLSGPAVSTNEAGATVTYTVSIKNMPAVTGIELEFELDGSFMSSKDFNAIGFGYFGDGNYGTPIFWKNDGDVWTGKVTLLNMDGGVAGKADVLEMVFNVKEGVIGVTDVKLNYVRLSFDGDEVFPEVVNGLVTTEFVQWYSPYDLNRDGVVDLNDVTWALQYLMMEDGDAGWDAAKAADVTGDGRVDIEDLLLILANYTIPYYG